MRAILVLFLITIISPQIFADEATDCNVRFGASINGSAITPLGNLNGREVRVYEGYNDIEIYFRLNTSKRWQQSGIHGSAYVDSEVTSNEFNVISSGLASHSVYVDRRDNYGYIYISAETVGYPGGDAACRFTRIDLYKNRW